MPSSPAARLAVFDLDGTILDTMADLTNSLNYGLAVHGFPPRTIDEVCRFVGNGMRRLVELAVPHATDEAKLLAVLQDFQRHYALHCHDLTKPYPNIPELLTALKRRGVLTAVVSNKVDSAVQALCARYFPGQFDAVVGERVGIRRKPCPDSLLQVLSELSVSPDDAFYIGDSEVDIETARNAGLRCISVTWGTRSGELLRALGPAYTVDTPQEMLSILLGEK